MSDSLAMIDIMFTAKYRHIGYPFNGFSETLNPSIVQWGVHLKPTDHFFGRNRSKRMTITSTSFQVCHVRGFCVAVRY